MNLFAMWEPFLARPGRQTNHAPFELGSLSKHFGTKCPQRYHNPWSKVIRGDPKPSMIQATDHLDHGSFPRPWLAVASRYVSVNVWPNWCKIFISAAGQVPRNHDSDTKIKVYSPLCSCMTCLRTRCCQHCQKTLSKDRNIHGAKYGSCFCLVLLVGAGSLEFFP